MLRANFCEKNLELVENAIFMNVLKKFKTFCGKSHSVFEGLKGAPLNTLKLLSTTCF